MEALVREFVELCDRPEPRAEVARRVREAPRERRLDLLGMALMGLPAGLGKQLPMLSALLVNTNSIRTLPDSVGELRALERLNARFNVLGALPATIGLLGQLLSLDVSNNELVELPEALGQLPLLHTLDVHENQLTSLPASLIQLRKLSTLDTHRNRLGALPERLGELPALTSLDISANLLRELPDSIGHLKTLITLDLHANQLVALCDSIGQLACLQKLHASANRLVSLPSIGGMVSLRHLDISENILAELPTMTTETALSLRELLWKGNPLQRPPVSVANRVSDELEAERASRLIAFLIRLSASLIRDSRPCVATSTSSSARELQSPGPRGLCCSATGWQARRACSAVSSMALRNPRTSTRVRSRCDLP